MPMQDNFVRVSHMITHLVNTREATANEAEVWRGDSSPVEGLIGPSK